MVFTGWASLLHRDLFVLKFQFAETGTVRFRDREVVSHWNANWSVPSRPRHENERHLVLIPVWLQFSLTQFSCGSRVERPRPDARASPIWIRRSISGAQIKLILLLYINLFWTFDWVCVLDVSLQWSTNLRDSFVRTESLSKDVTKKKDFLIYPLFRALVHQKKNPRILPPRCFRLASSWSMMPPDVVSTKNLQDGKTNGLIALNSQKRFQPRGPKLLSAWSRPCLQVIFQNTIMSNWPKKFI